MNYSKLKINDLIKLLSDRWLDHTWNNINTKNRKVYEKKLRDYDDERSNWNFLNFNSTKKYLQISQGNLKYFLAKGFIFPLSISKNINNLYDDLLKLINNYVPIVSKVVFNYENNIFIEIDINDDDKLLEVGNGLFLYNWILPLSKIKKIYIQSKEVYESLINNTFDNLCIPKTIIFNNNINLEKSNILNIGEINIEKNTNIIKLKQELFENNINLGWQQLLKLVDQKLYNDFVFKNNSDDLSFLYNYNEEIIDLDNYNDHVLLFLIKKNILNEKFFEWNKSLNEFYTFYTETIKKFIDDWVITDEKITEKLRKKALNIKRTIDKKMNIKELLSSLDEEEDYWIIIFLLINKYWNIENFASFIELWINKIQSTKIKVLLSYIYWQIVWYSSLYVEKELFWKNIIFKLDINDEFDIDIYENKVELNKCREVPKLIKNLRGFQYVREIRYWDSDKVIWIKYFDIIEKGNIEWGMEIEKENNALKNEIIKLNSEIIKLNKDNYNYKNFVNSIEKAKKDLLNFKYNEFNEWTDWYYPNRIW